MTQLRRLIALGLAALATGAAADTAAGAVGDPYFQECFAKDAVTAPCAHALPANATAVVLSPDGKQLYAAIQNPFGVVAFDVGPGGRLTRHPGAGGCLTRNAAPGCTLTASPPQPGQDMAFSPDGRSLYVATGMSLLALRRDPGSGDLSPGTCHGSGFCAGTLGAVGSAHGVVVGPGGENVYVRGADTLGVLTRNTSTGALALPTAFEDCYFQGGSHPGCTAARGLQGSVAKQLVISPDGKFLYTPFLSGISIFGLGDDGSITQGAAGPASCLSETGNSGSCGTLADGSAPVLRTGRGVALSATGKHVVLTSSGGGAGASGTTVFSRDATSGLLTKTACVASTSIPTCGVSPGGTGFGVAVSPDETRVAVGSADIDGVGVFSLNPLSGALAPLAGPLACFSAGGASGCGGYPGTSGGAPYMSPAFSRDGATLWEANDGTLDAFGIDAAPTCQGGAVSTPFQAPVAIPLPCSDPNGDPVTRGISTGPGAGALSAPGDTVTYSPAAGFSGVDRFDFTGTARGLTSAPASVSVLVNGDPGAADRDGDGVTARVDCDDGNAAMRPGAADVPGNGVDEDCSGADAPRATTPPPPARPAKLAATVSATWRATRASTSLSRLTVKKPPAGLVVLVRCSGSGCPLRSKTVRVAKAASSLDLTGLFNVRDRKTRKVKVAKLRPGAKVDVTITRPATVGKTYRFTVRASRTPALTARCLQAGSATKTVAC